jgi:hypothetical protein
MHQGSQVRPRCRLRGFLDESEGNEYDPHETTRSHEDDADEVAAARPIIESHGPV